MIYKFWNCANLISVTLPVSLTTVESWAFISCNNLDVVHISDIAAWCATSLYWSSPFTYYAHLYLDDKEVTNLVIPEGITSIGSFTFYGCNHLTSVTIPDGVTEIEQFEFEGCSNLKKVIIPDSVTRIGNAAFCGCTSLTEIAIPTGVTDIGWDVFDKCVSLQGIHIPEGVTIIQRDTFHGCTSLTEISLPDSLTTIEDWAFAGCMNLKHIRMPKTAPYMERFSFIGCNTEYYHGPLAAEQAAKMQCSDLAYEIDTMFRAKKDMWQQSLPELLGVKGSQLQYVVGETVCTEYTLDLIMDGDMRFRLFTRMRENGLPLDETAFYRLYGHVGRKILPLVLVYANANMDANHFLHTLLKRRIGEQRELVGKYRDYLSMKRRIQSPASEVLKVSEILHEHDEMVREYNRVQQAAQYDKNKRLMSQFRAAIQSKAYRKALYGNDRFIVVAPAHPIDLVTEGQVLSHCVGDYVDEVVSGESKIYFVRHAEAPDEPYCTVELKESYGKLCMTQCFNAHDKHDGNPERIAFIHEWAGARNIEIQCTI